MSDDVIEAAEQEHERVLLNDLKKRHRPNCWPWRKSSRSKAASLLSKQELMFGVLKELAERDVEIIGVGVVEVLPDGFGFLRSPQSNYLAGPDDIYVQPQMIRKMGLRTGDTVEGTIRGPRDGERYFALVRVSTVNFEDPERARHKVPFDNLTPLYPDERLHMEPKDPTKKDRSGRVIDIVSPIGKGQRALIVAAAAYRQNRAAAEHCAVGR